MTVTKSVSDGLVERVSLYKKRFWLLRLDVYPFVLAYIVLNVALTQRSTKYYGLIGLPIVLFAHLLLFLLSQSSLGLLCFLGNYSVTDIDAAELVHVRAANNAGKDRIVSLHKDSSSSSKGKTVTVVGNMFHVPTISFEFQKITYRYDEDKNTFVRLEYPNVAPFMSMLESMGHHSSNDVQISVKKWGINEFDIPIPSFLDLYVEHLVAPFFMFQVICLFLWSLDDYWYYSAFTLLMLMFFEGMLCKQRQGSLLMLRNMRRPPVDMYVLRCGTWAIISSEDIVPGDIISLTTAPEPDTVPRHRSSHHRGGGSGGRRYEEDVDAADNVMFGTGKSDSAMIPCDAVVLRGTCVTNEAMLTGESVPQLKEALSVALADHTGAEGTNNNNNNNNNNGIDLVDLGTESNINAIWRRHLIFGGTSLVQHSLPTENPPESNNNHSNNSSNNTNNLFTRAKAAAARLPPAPDGGIIALVVRTAYGTTQGSLMRKILFATERVNANSSETFHFIGVLVVFAVMASAVVLHQGLQDENRNKFRLALHCIMILTSVVPPELPMELSLAVTNSLAALSRDMVFCTEPFRIPFAGKLDVLCFDKTGTLTKDKMILKGVVLASSSAVASTTENAAMIAETVTNFSSLPVSALAIMGGCHSLLKANNSSSSGGMTTDVTNQVVGDPLEKATFEASGFLFSSGAKGGGGGGPESTVLISPQWSEGGCGLRMVVKHRYPFSSALKRMSTIVECLVPETDGDEGPSTNPDAEVSTITSGLYVLTKGAPEVLEESALIADLPSSYRATYQFHMSRGRRVLALAYRKLTPTESSQTSGLARVEVEKGLLFAGFLLFDCDLKADSKSVIRELRGSDHRVVMITGDSAYTAADVAAKLGMTRGADKGVLVLEDVGGVFGNNNISGKDNNSVNLRWRSISAETTEKDILYDTSSVALDKLAVEHALCVTGPALAALEKMVAGNDNGTTAILQALCPRVTIFARVSPAQKETVLRSLNDAGLFTLMCGDGTNDVGALKAAHVGVSIVNDPSLESRIEDWHLDSGGGQQASTGGGKKPKGASAKERVARAMLEMQAQEIDPTIVKLGDASIASPFTARRTSVDCVLTVLRQGRCTLVTSIQVFKVLALNCLVSAYMMSALYLRGLKQGDMQMTASGLISAGLFFFLSQAKPLQNLSPEKPPSSVFNRSVVASVAGQFVVHLACLVATLALSERYITEEDPTMSADGKFQPNTVNSAVFLLSAVMQVNNFVVNYRGHPFTQSIQENTPLWRSVQIIYASLLVIAGGQLEPLNDLLQMAPFPSSEFQASIIAVLVANFLLCYGIEHFSIAYFK